MVMSTQPVYALIPVQCVKEPPVILEQTHLLSYIATVADGLADGR